jgi:hypothetical protein
MGLIYPLQLYSAAGKPTAGGRRMVRIVEHTPDCTICDRAAGRSRGAGMICRRQLARIKTRALRTIEELRGGNIEPDPRDGARTCRGCAFRAICPAPQG